MRTEMVLDAVEMARWSRGTRIDGLIVHSDAGSQFTSVRFTERVAEIGARPSIGTVADSYDNALAEATNGLYKTELTKPYGVWKTVEELELATLGWVDWFNTKRLHGTLGDIPPTEYETNWAEANKRATPQSDESHATSPDDTIDHDLQTPTGT